MILEVHEKQNRAKNIIIKGVIENLGWRHNRDSDRILDRYHGMGRPIIESGKGWEDDKDKRLVKNPWR